MDHRTPWQAKHEIDGLDEEGQARSVDEQAYREFIRRLYITCESAAVLQGLLNRLGRGDGYATFIEPLLQQQRKALNPQTDEEWELCSLKQQELQEATD